MLQIFYHSYGKTGIAACVMLISVETGIEAKGREISGAGGHSCLRESESSFSAFKKPNYMFRDSKRWYK